MKLSALTAALSIRLQEKLPGVLAHEPMRAIPIGNIKPNFTHKLPPKLGGVLILLYEEDGIIKFPLTKRQEYKGAHSGQISLPGGKAEPGESAVETALREGYEEIGVNTADVKVLGTLTEFFVIPSNFLVTPVVAAVQKSQVFSPDSFEVARIISCSIDELVNEKAVIEKEIIAAGNFLMRAPHFEIEGEIVWGATAMMLNEFRMVLKEIIV
jgi:8-oxo-dGTP pyrophosphatase MutT (NUDIX family)